MQQFNYQITDKLGLHARPAGLLVKTVQPFDCSITLTCNGKTADAKKLFSVMGLGAKFGDIIQVSCDGDGETAAAKAIETFLQITLTARRD